MAICKLDLNNQVLLIIVTSIVLGMNFRSSFSNVNYHMDCGNFSSLTYDPFLILIKNIISSFFFVVYYIELKINKINRINNEKSKKTDENEDDEEDEDIIKNPDKKEEDLGVIESIFISNKLFEKKDKFCFVIKVSFLLIITYVFEDINFIVTNNHILDRLICAIRNVFALIAILILSAILFYKKIDKNQIKNFLMFKKHQIIPLIIICILSVFLLLYNALKIPRFQVIYNINLLYYFICCILLGLELTLTKYLMETLYINKLLILGMRGLIGTVAFIVINLKVNKDDFFKFFDDIFLFQYTLRPEDFHIMHKISYVLTLILYQYLKVYVIDKFGEMHFLSSIMITDILLFPLYCIERFIIQGFNISTKDTFFINIIISIMNTLLMLIFNEILELNFCGLNSNLRKYIIQREKKDKANLIKLIKITNEDNYPDEVDEEAESK